MKLLIVESPSKAKTIEKYLGKDFRVVASVGHIRDLPKSNKSAIDIPAGFVPHYEVVKGKEKIISEIKSLAKKADEVLLATDPDREGEAIAWHVAEACGFGHGEQKSNHNNPKTKRIVFYEITKEAVEEALEHPREIDTNLREAQEESTLRPLGRPGTISGASNHSGTRTGDSSFQTGHFLGNIRPASKRASRTRSGIKI